MKVVKVFGDDFTKNDLEFLKELDADVGYYWYSFWDYGGQGYLLIQKDGKWYLHDCGHCSCNTPLDTIYDSLRVGYDSLNGLLDCCTDELRQEIMPLVEQARIEGKEDRNELS
ncbi:MAG: hypothetical protein D6726_07925 [Nitrospirae bacterium]|nr:MAG: hypothetical protein D6726_07925 [Nitrospirota bacterium]